MYVIWPNNCTYIYDKKNNMIKMNAFLLIALRYSHMLAIVKYVHSKCSCMYIIYYHFTQSYKPKISND